MSAALLAINWEPELRGVLTVILGTVAFMGSVYLILGTNIGAPRLPCRSLRFGRMDGAHGWYLVDLRHRFERC